MSSDSVGPFQKARIRVTTARRLFQLRLTTPVVLSVWGVTRKQVAERVSSNAVTFDPVTHSPAAENASTCYPVQLLKRRGVPLSSPERERRVVLMAIALFHFGHGVFSPWCYCLSVGKTVIAREG